MYKYLFICQENIGRSQMAEAFLNHKLGGNYSISAGLVDSTTKYNGHPRPDVIQVMQEVEIDIHNHRIKVLTRQMLEIVEKIVVLCEKDMCPDIVINKPNVAYFMVNDPPDKDKTIDVLRNMREQIETIVARLK